MASLSRELVFLILQFLDEEKFRGTLHRLEQESGFHFNLQHFEDLILQGKWDDVERYLSGFSALEDNRYSMKIYFEIRKQKYLEALELKEKTTAIDILMKDLKVFQALNSELYKEMTSLLVLDNFRENEKLAHYGDARTARVLMFQELKKLIESNPVFQDKLEFPKLPPSRLRTVVNQALNWQHKLCKRPKPAPEISTLFVDHSCDGEYSHHANGALGSQGTAAGTGQLTLPILQGQQNHVMYSQSMPVTHNSFPGQPLTTSLGLHAAPQFLNLQQTPMLMPMQMSHIAQPMSVQAYQHQEQQKRTRESGQNTAVQPGSAGPVVQRPSKQRKQKDGQVGGLQKTNYTAEDLPTSVKLTLRFTCQPTALSFHPHIGNFLAVGDAMGSVSLFDVSSTQRLWSQNMSTSSKPVQVNKVVWSPDGGLVGVALSNGRVALQAANAESASILGKPVEVLAHEGSVNDLRFVAKPGETLAVITCGDDKLVNVWDVRTGEKLHTFEGHKSAVCCVCPQTKDSISFLLSTSKDGTIKVWFYNNPTSQVDFSVEGQYCTYITYSADGKRLFSCGRGKESKTTLFEWDEQSGSIKQRFTSFANCTEDSATIDTVANRFIAAVDDHKLKFWEFDKPRMLFSMTLDEELPPSAPVCFNCAGTLLAVLGTGKFVKVLASSKEAAHLPRTAGAREAVEKAVIVEPTENAVARVAQEVTPTESGSLEMVVGKASTTEELVPEVSERAACISKLLEGDEGSSIEYLLFNNGGTGLLALDKNAKHKFWRWDGDNTTVFEGPSLWRPSPSAVMTNDEAAGEEPVLPCMAVSRNDSYVLSASGGKVSLFNLLSFKIMAAFMPPPPAASCLAFHLEDNNIIAIGRDDGSLLIYNVRLDDVKVQLKGHDAMISGLAFSTKHKCLVSVSSDSKLCVWDTTNDSYSKKLERSMLSGKLLGGSTEVGRVCCMFSTKHEHLLVVRPDGLDLLNVPEFEKVASWTLQGKLTAPITSGCFSCDAKQVFCGFRDGRMAVFDGAKLSLTCCFHPKVVGEGLYPTAMASHTKPGQSSQFALGLSNGNVLVLEPKAGSTQPWGQGM